MFFLSRKFFFVHLFVLIFPVYECLGSIARLPAAFREMSLHSCCTPTRVDRKVACVASVSVWCRSKERPSNDEKRDFRFWPHDKWNKSSLPPSSFTRPIFRTVFDSRNLFFAPKPHGNACNASKRQGTKPHPLERRRKIDSSECNTVTTY